MNGRNNKPSKKSRYERKSSATYTPQSDNSNMHQSSSLEDLNVLSSCSHSEENIAEQGEENVASTMLNVSNNEEPISVLPEEEESTMEDRYGQKPQEYGFYPYSKLGNWYPLVAKAYSRIGMNRSLSQQNVMPGTNVSEFTSNNKKDRGSESQNSKDEIIREKQVHDQSRIPRLGTNIDDIRKTSNFHQYGKRFIIVGLNYECHTFRTLRELINHITSVSANKIEEVSKPLKFEDPVWIDIQNPSITDMKMMEKYFCLHPLTTEDIINLDTGEKWELFSDYMFVVFTGQVDDEAPPPPTLAKTLVHQLHHQSGNETQLNILVFKDYVITIHDRPIKGLDLLMKRIETEFEFDIETGKIESKQPMYKYDIGRAAAKKTSIDRSTTKSGKQKPSKSTTTQSSAYSEEPSEENLKIPILSGESQVNYNTEAQGPPLPPPAPKRVNKRTHIPSSDWILYAFLDAMVDMYIPFVDSLMLEVDNLDELVFLLEQSEQSDLLKRLGLAKRNVVTLRRLLFPKQKMTAYLASQPIRFLSHNVQLYLRDVLDHLQICLEKLEVARENLNQAHNNYLTKVQIEIAEASSRTDAFMNRITVIASLLGPLTLISSVWGMNVKVPGQDDDGYWWFFGICAGMLVVTLILAILLRNKLISK